MAEQQHERLKRLRLAAGYATGAELAAAAGLSPHRYRHYEREDGRGIPRDVAPKLADLLKVSVRYLLTGKEEGDELTDEQRELLRLYGSLPPEVRRGWYQSGRALEDALRPKPRNRRAG